MRKRILYWGLSAAAIAIVACSKSNSGEGKTAPSPSTEEVVTNPGPASDDPPQPLPPPPPPPPPPPKPAFDRPALLALVDESLNRCIEFAPAVQFLSDNVVRIQYIHGCGDFEKSDAGKVMWQILERCVSLAAASGVEMPTFRIHAFTRNGSSFFTSVTTPKDVTRLMNKEMGFDDWLVRIGDGPKKLATSKSESDYLKALPAPPADAKLPDGDDIKTDLTAYIEDLECADDVSKLNLGKVVTIGYKQVCAKFEDADIRLTMYEVALRVIKQLDKHGVWSGIDISARADNGGGVFSQRVPAQILQGVKDRQVGIIDWVTRGYGGASGPSGPRRTSPRRDCHEGEGCVLLPEQYRGTSEYLECQNCCYGVSRLGAGMFPYSCKGEGE